MAIPGAAVALVLGAVALVVGPLMPWVEVTVPVAGTVVRTGVDGGGDAVFCLVVGVAACLVGLRGLLLGGATASSATERAVVGTVGILGLICAALGLGAAHDLDGRLGATVGRLPGFVRSLVDAEVGAGVWVVAAGGLMVAIAALAQVVAAAPPHRGVRAGSGVSSPEVCGSDAVADGSENEGRGT